MIRLGSLAAVLILVSCMATAVSAQEPPDRSAANVDCDSICLIFPEQAPAECACTVEGTGGTSTGGIGAGGGTVVDPAAAAVIGAMFASYREA